MFEVRAGMCVCVRVFHLATIPGAVYYLALSTICAMTHSRVPWLLDRPNGGAITGDWTISLYCHDSPACAMTHSCVLWLIHTYHDSFIFATIHSRVTWLANDPTGGANGRLDYRSVLPGLTHTCRDSLARAVTHSYVPWLIHTYHDSFIRATTH